MAGKVRMSLRPSAGVTGAPLEDESCAPAGKLVRVAAKINTLPALMMILDGGSDRRPNTWDREEGGIVIPYV
jgi:hypothetical protein